MNDARHYLDFKTHLKAAADALQSYIAEHNSPDAQLDAANIAALIEEAVTKFNAAVDAALATLKGDGAKV